jgi:hypothetical protein
VAVTENERPLPAHTVWLTGCNVITGGVFTVIVKGDEFALHTPLVTTTLNWVVWVKYPGPYDEPLSVISVQVLPPLIDDCHLVIVPV